MNNKFSIDYKEQITTADGEVLAWSVYPDKKLTVKFELNEFGKPVWKKCPKILELHIHTKTMEQQLEDPWWVFTDSLRIMNNFITDNNHTFKVPNEKDFTKAAKKLVNISEKDPNQFYDIGQKIGEGVFGAVYLATRKSDDREMVVKCAKYDDP